MTQPVEAIRFTGSTGRVGSALALLEEEAKKIEVGIYQRQGKPNSLREATPPKEGQKTRAVTCLIGDCILEDKSKGLELLEAFKQQAAFLNGEKIVTYEDGMTIVSLSKSQRVAGQPIRKTDAQPGLGSGK